METSVSPPKGPQHATATSLRKPCGIGDLPPEVLLIIFQFFNVQQLHRTISPVCRLWRDLSQRPCLRLKLALEGKRPDTAVAIELLRSCPNLKNLSISDRDDVLLLLCHAGLNNRELRRLAVKNCKHNLPHYFNYRSLFGPNKLGMIATRCRKLEEIISLNWDTPLCDEDIPFVAERLCGTLKVLEIDGDYFSDAGVAALGQFYQLRTLFIQNACKITDDGMHHLSRLQNLESLHLTQAKNVTYCGWVQLFSKSHWRQMNKLSLVDCPTVNDDTLLLIENAYPNLMSLILPVSGSLWMIDKEVFQRLAQN